MNSSSPLIRIANLAKQYGDSSPLRIRSLVVNPGERLTVAGFDAAAAEMFMHLVSGAAVPDAGQVMIAGVDTRTIATDTEWLASLDRFGLVSNRAVLLESLPVAANLALPITLAVEPLAPDVRVEVGQLAETVGLAADSLDGALGALDALGRMRVHLGRAIAGRPELLLLEDPTRDISSGEQREAFGRSLRRACDVSAIGWLALSSDEDFARGAAAPRWRLDTDAGTVDRRRRWWLFGS